MNTIQISAPAKINLWLNVKNKRPDGYHNIDSIMLSVSLCDTVTLSANDTGSINVRTVGDNLPSDFPDGNDNIAYKAARLFLLSFCYLNYGVDIKIEKNIPIGAGLAGGSADAAAVLIGLNRLFSTKLSLDELCDLGRQIGADVPFCIKKGSARVSGIGDIIEYITPIDLPFTVIAIGNETVSTSQAYSELDEIAETENCGIDEIILGGFENYRGDLFNSFERVILPKVKSIEAIKSIMNYNQARYTLMSGSGPSVFGIFNCKNDADKALCELKSNGYSAYFAYTVLSENQ